MSDPALGLTMLVLIVIVIMMGFPTAFTLMGLGMSFGFIAFYDPSQPWTQNKVFDLMVERTYGAMNNESLISIPLFVLMGYVMERGALVDKMFYSIQLAFRNFPASLAVATLIVCTFWGIASGLVGAVVVLMGVIAMNPMLKAGYDVRLASGAITAGGTLGILIPPSVMIIVYAAVAGQSVVKLYASAMFPGFFLALLYLLYIVGWALIDPKIAPKAHTVIPVSAWVLDFQRAYARNVPVALIRALVAPRKAKAIAINGRPMTRRAIAAHFAVALFPLLLFGAIVWGVWWYVVIHPQASLASAPAPPVAATPAAPANGIEQPAAPPLAPPIAPPLEEQVGLQEPVDTMPQELGVATDAGAAAEPSPAEQLEEMGNPELLKQGAAAPVEEGPPEGFFLYFWLTVAAAALWLVWYYAKMGPAQFELLKLLSSSVMPLGILTIVVLAVILFGITTATESAAIGAAGAFLLGFHARTLDWERIKQSVFLTAKTTAMVCWLFVGSALFSAVFALLGGQQLVEHWVLSFNLSPVQFMILSQAIIFLLGWPLEWTEIIVIFVPIFLPLLKHFNIDPILWGTLVFVNLQAAFLSPPVAMSAFYLKGVSPPHVTLNQIFAGMMPYMLVVILCMVIMYLWPGLTLWLPNYLYGGG
ncbi:MAG TPA: TRAP transporter large permease subunit [Casimicrobiaceae bacterium]|nr:TRAP transporter large permease subunit [Casimicrobiaceae bacterium]